MSTVFKNLVFLDIETVSLTKSFAELDVRLQSAWTKKARLLDPKCESVSDYYFDKAAIYAEFGKIIVIGVGYFHENEKGELSFRAKALKGHSEFDVLNEFCELIRKGFASEEVALCAHNGKEFDFPYLCRRMLVNGIPLPDCLQLAGKKPWQVRHYDTLEMWKFGDRKHFTSLELLAAIFNIPSSKEGIDGSMVNKAYYLEDDLAAIAEYCKRDVAVLAQLFLKMNSLPQPQPENIVWVD